MRGNCKEKKDISVSDHRLLKVTGALKKLTKFLVKIVSVSTLNQVPPCTGSIVLSAFT